MRIAIKYRNIVNSRAEEISSLEVASALVVGQGPSSR